MGRKNNNMKTAPQKATESVASHLTYNRIRESTRHAIIEVEDYNRFIRVYNLLGVHLFPSIRDVFDGVSGEIK